MAWLFAQIAAVDAFLERGKIARRRIFCFVVRRTLLTNIFANTSFISLECVKFGRFRFPRPLWPLYLDFL